MSRISVITSLYNSQNYLQGYFNALSEIVNKEELEILLIHNAANAEELAIINSRLPQFPFIKHIRVEREGLYNTWNRGVKLATADYLTVWNVDDVHLPESLKNQADALDQNPGAALAYGDFIIVNNYGDTEGYAMNEPEFSSSDPTFLRRHHIGCFPMWRKSVHDKIGYFDEQFRLIADLDFQIRVAKSFAMIKIPQQLGYYLEGTPGNLSSNSRIQDMEHTVLHIRYGNFNQIFLTYFFESLVKFKLFEYKWYEEFHKMEKWSASEYVTYFSRMPLVIVSLFKLPRHLARRHLKPYFYRMFPVRPIRRR